MKKSILRSFIVFSFIALAPLAASASCSGDTSSTASSCGNSSTYYCCSVSNLDPTTLGWFKNTTCQSAADSVTPPAATYDVGCPSTACTSSTPLLSPTSDSTNHQIPSECVISS